MTRRKSLKPIFVIILIIALAGVVCLGIQFFTKTGLFKIPGKLIYDESLSSEQQSALDKIFYDESEKLTLELDKDVTISARYATTDLSMTREYLDEHTSTGLIQIYVPVTDFYSTVSSISTDDLKAAIENGMKSDDFELIPVADLDSTVRLLGVDNSYYLEDFTSGAAFLVYTFSGDNDEDLQKVSMPILSTVPEFPNKSKVLSFAQTGVTALSRGMNAKLKSVGDATYFSEEIAPFLSSFDLTHISNESSFSNYASASNICSDHRFIDTILDIGTDIVELTGNHNQDCGDEAARETIKIYEEKGLLTVGGGVTADAAKKPLELNDKGTGITMLAYNLSTGGYTRDNTPGANFYDEDDLVSNIASAKERGDFVIVDIQFYECDDYNNPTWTTRCLRAASTAPDPTYGSEQKFFRHLIDLGADLVLGTSAHQMQTFERYGDGVIYYGLGNLFFDQIWWPDTRVSIGLGHYFYKGKLLQTRLFGTEYGNDMKVKLMSEEDLGWYIGQLNAAR